MTTILYLVLLLGIGAAYTVFAWSAIAHGASGIWYIAGLPLAYVAVAAILVLAWFFMSRIWGDSESTGERLGAGGHARMLVRELLTVLSSWPVIALHRLFIRDPRKPSPGVPILLIHGVWNNDGVWLGFRRRLARRVSGPVYTINCGPTLGDIERFAEQLHEKIGRIRAATGSQRVVLVGHSMGGLIARAYLRRYGGVHVAKLITIGTPHHGSMLATVAVGRCVEQMRPGNAWLVDLNRHAHGDAHETPIVTIWSRHDTMVAPQTSSRLPGARSVMLEGVAHNALLRSPDVLAAVVAEIESPRAAEVKPALQRVSASS